MSVRGLEITR